MINDNNDNYEDGDEEELDEEDLIIQAAATAAIAAGLSAIRTCADILRQDTLPWLCTLRCCFGLRTSDRPS